MSHEPKKKKKNCTKKNNCYFLQMNNQCWAVTVNNYTNSGNSTDYKKGISIKMLIVLYVTLHCTNFIAQIT